MRDKFPPQRRRLLIDEELDREAREDEQRVRTLLALIGESPDAGFRVDHQSRFRRARRMRAIGEMLDLAGDPVAALRCYDWALAGWDAVGCKARAKTLRQRLEEHR